MLPLRKILCPTDFSEPSYKALEAANELPLHFSAALALVYVVPLVIDVPTSVDFYIPSDIQTAQARAEKALEEVVEKRISEKVRIRTKVVIGDPGDEIVKTAAGVCRHYCDSNAWSNRLAKTHIRIGSREGRQACSVPRANDPVST